MPDHTGTEFPLDGRPIVVSNRQPYRHRYDEDGTVVVDRPTGGLTAGLDPVMQRARGTWIAWGDGEADHAVVDENDHVALPPEDPAYTLRRVWLSEEEVDGYYYGYSNRVLWPLCHGMLWKAEFADQFENTYREVNRTFADVVVEETSDDDVVWFQDYHFTFAPRMVQEHLDAFVMQFWHITWPGWDTFRSLPNNEDVLRGLLGNDLLCFHLDRYCRNFLNCVDERLDDAFIDRDGLRVHYDDHTTTLRAFPLSVDADAIAETSARMNRTDWRAFADRLGVGTGENVALGVDRLDYTKGIPERLAALERLWERSPEWRGKLTYVQKATESRSIIPDYQDLQERVDEAVERINDRFGTEEWTPVIYVDDYLSSEELYGLYRYSDLMLVSALRDGMNLVAKEFVAAQIDCDDRVAIGERRDDCGMLVLSDQAGVHEELSGDAVSINPHDTDAFVDAIEEALTMSPEERRHRMRRLRRRVTDYDLDAWMADVFGAIRTTRRRREKA